MTASEGFTLTNTRNDDLGEGAAGPSPAAFEATAITLEPNSEHGGDQIVKNNAKQSEKVANNSKKSKKKKGKEKEKETHAGHEVDQTPPSETIITFTDTPKQLQESPQVTVSQTEAAAVEKEIAAIQAQVNTQPVVDEIAVQAAMKALVDCGLQVWKVVNEEGVRVRTLPDHASAQTGSLAAPQKYLAISEVVNERGNTYLKLHPCNELGLGWVFTTHVQDGSRLIENVSDRITEDKTVATRKVLRSASDTLVVKDWHYQYVIRGKRDDTSAGHCSPRVILCSLELLK
jgi:hypothetical protein